MSAFLIISFGCLVAVSIVALFFRGILKNQNNRKSLPKFRQNFRGLFAPSDAEIRRKERTTFEKILAGKERTRKKLAERIQTGDFSTLVQAHENDDPEIYTEVFALAFEKSEISALIDFLKHHDELRVSPKFVKNRRETWQKNPTRKKTIDFLHFAARTNSAQVLLEAIEEITQNRRDNDIHIFSDEDLVLLLEGEFQTLSSHEKSSGAGFLIKQKIASLRRELKK